jgi:hypothetical protein
MARPPANIQSGIKDQALVNGRRIKLIIDPQANIFVISIFVSSFILTPFPSHNQNKILRHMANNLHHI